MIFPQFEKLFRSVTICVFAYAICSGYCFAASMSDYCSVPPYIAQILPPLVMLDVARDHKLYYEAYNDAADLDGDGKLDIDYTHSIDYYGYFDLYKCYTYDTGTSMFKPAKTTATKFCSSNQWSGNVLNWLTMTRMDVLRKVLYGGHRSVDDSSNTLLQRVYVPNDAHSWGKELTGKLCSNGTAYTTNCAINADCDSGYSCTDPTASGNYLVPFTTATTPTTCTATAVTSENSGKVLVASYKHSSSKNCGLANSAALIASYEPANLFAHPSLVNYVNGFEDTLLDPSIDHDSTDNYNILAVTSFTADATGTWQFAVAGDDDAEVQISDYGSAGAGTIVAQNLGCHGAPDVSSAPNGSISLVSGKKYTIVARHFEKGGNDGVRVWFKRPSYSSTCTATDSVTSGSIDSETTVCSNKSGTLSFPNGKSSTGNCTSYRPCVCTYSQPCTITPSNWTYVTSNSDTTGHSSGVYAPLALSAPNINSGNECAIMDTEFITTGIPQVGKTVVVGTTSNRHLFCNTTADGSNPASEPILRVLTDRSERIWSWSAKEHPVCDTSLGTPLDYSVRVKVCDSTMPESNCKTYGSSLKPTGLLHKYGEGDGTKVCSKNFSKTCTTKMSDSSDCDLGEGLCVYRSPMYFGMMSGSYKNNTQGGVLRKNISSFMEEVSQTNGTFAGTNGIVHTFDNMRIDTFSGGTYSCGWVTSGPISNDQCNDWGNPLAEIMYETLRYFSGKGSATSDYAKDISDGNDLGLDLPMPAWGVKNSAGTTFQPYQMYPTCARPFSLFLSDINTSYDGDQIPGSAFAKYAEDTNSPTLNLGNPPSTASGLASYNKDSLLRAMTNLIGTQEGMNDKDWFIGDNSLVHDNLCTAKTVTDLSLVKGLCPEEPTKQGTYYLPALAYYGKTQLKANASIPNMETFSVALASPVADLKIKVGGNYVTIAPTAKSVSGCESVYANCASKLTFSDYDEGGTGLYKTGKGLIIPSSTAFCPTNQIVNFFVDDVRYDGTDVVYANFRINYEDVEQGADHDMDAIVKYEICTATAIANGYGTCGETTTTPSLASNQFQIKLTSEYAAGCIDQVMGFNLSGTGSKATDGTYLLIKDADVGNTPDSDTPSAIANLPTYASRVFTASGTESAFLKNPLWYAAKWGGFNDGNGNGIPDTTSEWAKNDGLNPDNYFLVVNPLKLETQLNNALTSILKETSSGTAASILNNSGESGTNILQAVYYPQKDFKGTTISWTGELQNMWYYLDPRVTGSTVREDTVPDGDVVGDKILDLNSDLPVNIAFDSALGKTFAYRLKVDGTAKDKVDLDDLGTLWRAGALLQSRNIDSGSSPRKIKTSTDGFSFTDFTQDYSSSLQASLQATDDAESKKIINYITGYDTPSDSTLRNRTVTYKGVTGPWRLGDIISSSPKVQGGTPMQGYDLDYNDLIYKKFWGAIDYKKRNMVYAGANDGMLHAFTLGVTTRVSNTNLTQVAKITPNTSPPLGQEEWAYIPRNALPYLRYLLQPDYSHLYTVDGNIRLIDVSTNVTKPVCSNDSSISCGGNSDCVSPGTCVAPCTEYWNCLRKTTLITSGKVCSNDYSTSCNSAADCTSGTCVNNTRIDPDDTSWRTLLISGMGLGGASREANGTCASSTTVSSGTLQDCVKAPITTTTPSDMTKVGLSSYFALDVTDPQKPLLKWEFSDPRLGYTLSQPAIVRINGVTGGGGTTANDPDTSKNGRWFAIFPSGPTGPVNSATHQFYGKSDQTLKLFIIDLGAQIDAAHPFVETSNYWVIDTGITNAFGGPFGSNSAVDTDAWNPKDQGYVDSDNKLLDPKGYYSTDVVYLGYTYYDTADNKWKGGVLRLWTHEDLKPDNWSWSNFIKGTGPVTTAVTTLQNRKTKQLWIYFGTGRYFYKDSTGIDDPDSIQYLYGIKEPCYPRGSGMTAINDFDVTCPYNDDKGTLKDSLAIKDNNASTTANAGWKIALWGASSKSKFEAERLLSNPTAVYTGNVIFSTFQPSADICGYGGQSFVWVVDGMSGGAPLASSLTGQKAVIQLSTGALAQVDLASVLKARLGRRSGSGSDDNASTDNKDETSSTSGGGLFGGANGGDIKILKPPKGVPRILHYKEK